MTTAGIPTPNLADSIATLSSYAEFKTILKFVADERDKFFGDLRASETPNDVMKIAGSVAALDELLSVLSLDSAGVK